MILIVGLGNPEDKYKMTYHNVGFLVLDALCEKYDIYLTKSKCKSLVFEGNINGKKVVIAKPQTYMNNSGQAVVELTNKFKPEKTLIIYDDIDIAKGTIRYRQNGSAGTHNGMRSVISLMGTQDINRLRIGIKSEQTVYDLADYVLSKMDLQSYEKIDSAIQNAVDFIEDYLK